MIVSIKKLTERILKRKVVKVKNGDGLYEEVEIQKVLVETFVSRKATMLKSLVNKSKEDIQQILLEEQKTKQITEIMTPVLLEGVVNPNLVDKKLEDCDLNKELPLEVLLIDLELTTNLYLEILSISLPKE